MSVVLPNCDLAAFAVKALKWTTSVNSDLTLLPAVG